MNLYLTTSFLLLAYTTKETLAINLIKALEASEVDSLWRESSTVVGVEEKVWLGMPFTSSKPRMEHSILFKLLKEMPKAALLHCHLDAM